MAQLADDSEQGEDERAMLHATHLDQAQLQRSGVSAMARIRSLGTGAFAAVDLVSMPVGGMRKLLVSKRLQQQQQPGKHAAAAPAPPPLRASSQADWEREAAMHRACAGCPFVLQLLAAKRCRSGDLLLLTEYASSGSLTQLMTARRQQQLPRQAAPALAAAPNPAAAGETASLASSSGSSAVLSAPLAAACSGGLTEASTRFVAACVLMALTWMHERRMLHRDIKPCNLLLFGDGYVKLADLGCCCQLPPGMHARTRTGTSAYMAPEVAGGDTPYSYAVDMWSLGVTMYEMAAGALPCWAADGQPAGRAPLDFPPHFSQELQQLLRGLLAAASAERFDVQQAVDAPFFDGFDWAGLQDRSLVPPPYS